MTSWMLSLKVNRISGLLKFILILSLYLNDACDKPLRLFQWMFATWSWELAIIVKSLRFEKVSLKKFYIFDFQEATGLEEFRHCGDRDGGFPGRAGRRPGHTCPRQITLPKRHIQKCLLHFGCFSRGKELLTALDMTYCGWLFWLVVTKPRFNCVRN